MDMMATGTQLTEFVKVEDSASIDMITLGTTIAIAIVGWIIGLLLQRANIRHQHKVTILYEIYNQFIKLHKKVQTVLGKLNAKASPPFILMDSSMIAFELKLKRQYKDMWFEWTEEECVYEGEKKWSEHLKSLQDTYMDFVDEFVNFHYLFEDWTSPLHDLAGAQETLLSEGNRLKKRISKNLRVLQSYTSEHGNDWRKWDRRNVEEVHKNIGADSLEMSSYFGDYMVLVHNELLSTYFGKERPLRKTLDPNYKVLTKKGIELRLEEDHQRKLRELLEKIAAED